MQLPLSADALAPLGLGAMVALVAVIAVVLGPRRNRDDSSSPTQADWTGEEVEVSAAPAASGRAGARRTVADAIAARRADTNPLQVVPAVGPLPSAPAFPATPEAERAPAAEPTLAPLPDVAAAPDRAIAHQSSVAAGSSAWRAVAHALAARAAFPTPGADRCGDARDRLLSVLLDDPLRAVGAAEDLLDCQERMDRLTGALGEERGKLRDVLGRLARSGLRADQLAKLSGLSDSEVTDLLRHAS